MFDTAALCVVHIAMDAESGKKIASFVELSMSYLVTDEPSCDSKLISSIATIVGVMVTSAFLALESISAPPCDCKSKSIISIWMASLNEI